VRAADRAARLHVALRALECAAAASFAAACVVTAGLLEGSALNAPLVLVAAVIGVAAGAMLWREHPPRAASVARRADARAGLEGALTTALDALRRQRTTEVALLLAAQVAARVAPRDLGRAALPRSPLAIVAPLAGAALVALALERTAPPASVAGSTASSAGLRAASQQSRARGDAPTADVLDAAVRRAEAAERLPAGPQSARARAAAADELARLAATLETRAAASGPPSDAGAAAGRDAIERAIAALDPRSPAGLSGTGAGPAAGGGGGAARTQVGQGLANQAGDGRMLGPPTGGESGSATTVPFAGTATSGGPGRGATAARWWPRRYDAVVERYLAP